MLQLNLQRVLKARGIETPYKFLVQSGFVPFTAHKYKNGKVEHMRLDHIEKLCTLLNCTPNDIFEWQPDTLLDDRANHPLQKIRKRDKKLEINKILSRLSLEKLEEIEQMLKQEAPEEVVVVEPKAKSTPLNVAANTGALVGRDLFS
jgi:DNA-binding Xre family transcriptional regulator